MARNRKRAKERRARRTGSSGGRPAVATARIEDAAPDPIEHAAPDVELAEAQLAVGRPEPEEEPEPDEEPEAEEEFEDDELEPEEAADGAGGGGPLVPTAAAAGVPEPRARPRGRLIGFLQGSWRELQRVQWPDRRQVAQATSVVLGFVIVAGLYLAAADGLASKLMDYILK